MNSKNHNTYNTTNKLIKQFQKTKHNNKQKQKQL